MNQCLHMFLKKMCPSDETAQSDPTIFRELTKVCKLMHMDELEVAAWSLHTDKLKWEMEDLLLEDFLIVTAIQIKEYMNDTTEAQIYTNKVLKEHPNLSEVYFRWSREDRHKIRFDIMDISKRFRKFRQVD